ncbi:MAG: hypothetical protein FWG11_04350 [Promicromonosporaceae bacterium]|nr:hypothetical protein [Promicromonosporaceae bacterium]
MKTTTTRGRSVARIALGLALAVGLAGSLSACSGDDDPVEANDVEQDADEGGKIVEPEEPEIEGFLDPADTGLLGTWHWEEDPTDIFEFFSDGTAQYSVYGMVFDITWGLTADGELHLPAWFEDADVHAGEGEIDVWTLVDVTEDWFVIELDGDAYRYVRLGSEESLEIMAGFDADAAASNLGDSGIGASDDLWDDLSDHPLVGTWASDEGTVTFYADGTASMDSDEFDLDLFEELGVELTITWQASDTAFYFIMEISLLGETETEEMRVEFEIVGDTLFTIDEFGDTDVMTRVG